MILSSVKTIKYRMIKDLFHKLVNLQNESCFQIIISYQADILNNISDVSVQMKNCG